MTKSNFLETACKNYCTHTSAPRHVRVPRSRNFSDCSSNILQQCSATTTNSRHNLAHVSRDVARPRQTHTGLESRRTERHTVNWMIALYNAPLAIRYPPDIRPRPFPGLIFSNIRPRSVTNWISTCGLNRFATCSLRSAECHRVKPTANMVYVICEVTGAQLVTAAQHTLQRVGSL